MTLNIFGNVFFSALFAVLAFFLFGLYACLTDKDEISRKVGTCVCIGICLIFLLTISISINVAYNKECEFAEKFIVQKTTIEQSLESESLSGLEKIELVNKAVDLNGELAERRLKLTRWYNVVWDKSVYKNIDYIKFE